jgi:hypothetical protein
MRTFCSPAFAVDPNVRTGLRRVDGNGLGQIETLGHRSGRGHQCVGGQFDDGLITHAGRTAVTSTSTRRLGHTSPSMMLSMAAG